MEYQNLSQIQEKYRPHEGGSQGEHTEDHLIEQEHGKVYQEPHLHDPGNVQ